MYFGAGLQLAFATVELVYMKAGGEIFLSVDFQIYFLIKNNAQGQCSWDRTPFCLYWEEKPWASINLGEH